MSARPDHWCERLGRAELAVLVVISPALLFPSPTRLIAAVAIPVLGYCQWRRGVGIVPRTPLNAAVVLLLAMVGVSLWVTPDVTFSLGKVCAVVLGICVFWAMTRWIASPRHLALAVLGYVAGGGVLAIAALAGTQWIDKFGPLAVLTAHLPKAIRGIPGAESGFQPNAVAGCLVLFVPVQAALLAPRARDVFAPLGLKTRSASLLAAAQVALFVVTGGALLLTQSRSAWIGVFVASATWLAWRSRRNRLLLLSAAAVAATIAAARPHQAVRVALRLLGPQVGGDAVSRMELWSRAILAIRDFPLTGVGMNMFRRIMPVLYPTGTYINFDVTHVHNQILQAALDVGLPGLVAYLSIWLVSGALLAQVCRRAADPASRILAGGLGAGLIAQFCFGLTDAITLGNKPAAAFWYLLALIVSLHRLALPAARYSEKPARVASS
jgi:putative inorganic carbon (HCO3(-)) transporter